jgi:hypothetical protein
MKNQVGFTLMTRIVLGIVAAAAAVTAYVVIAKPPMFDFITDKINSIVTPKPPIGNLTPARDITGTWISALNRKGFQLYGLFTTGPSTTKAYEDGNIELKIDKVEGNIATGQIRYTKMCAYAQTTAPVIGTITTPTKCAPDSGFAPVSIRVSSSSLDFGTISTGAITTAMQGSFTTDIMSGTMTLTTEYGIIKGEFHLVRQR